MCLTIDSKLHSDLKPLVARKNISVYKVLLLNGTKWITPYAETEVHFVFKKAKLKSRVLRKYGIYVTEGIHACTNSKEARAMARRFSNSVVFDAVVPKGTKFYFGNENDIVAEKLIIKYEALYY